MLQRVEGFDVDEMRGMQVAFSVRAKYQKGPFFIFKFHVFVVIKAECKVVNVEMKNQAKMYSYSRQAK